MSHQSQSDHLSDEDISRYLDDSLSADRRQQVEHHLRTCESCEQRFRQFQYIQKSARQQTAPTLNKNLWAAVRNRVEISEVKDPVDFSFSFLKQAAVVLIVLLIAAGVGIISNNYLNTPSTSTNSGNKVNQFAFDYGLYLSGLEEPSGLESFVNGYNRTPITIERVFSEYSSRYSLDLYKKLPREAKVDSAFTLESACCHCLQFVIHYGDNRIAVFQQPRKHPAEFTGFHKKHTKRDSLNFITVDAGNYRAYSMESGQSQYVMIGKRNDPMLTSLLKRLSKQ